jgi:hypothetical protein
MIKVCKRCHRTLKPQKSQISDGHQNEVLRVHNVMYCDICQNNINNTKQNNVYKHNKDTLNTEEKKRQQVKI